MALPNYTMNIYDSQSSANPSPNLLPAFDSSGFPNDIPDEFRDEFEEGVGAYIPGGFHPVYIGDVYNSRYKILSKLGFGGFSTVWFVEDLAYQGSKVSSKYRAMKINSAKKRVTFELEILKHLRGLPNSSPGYDSICHLLDDFEHTGPHGTHVCLVFELMGETLETFSSLFKHDRIPEHTMNRFVTQLLQALKLAHGGNVIHTDIKPDNIFVRIRDWSRIEGRYGYLASLPTVIEQNRNASKYEIVRSRPLINHYFNGTQLSDEWMDFEVVLGDWGMASYVDKHLSEDIQSIELRAPEVLLGAPWTEKVDLWNLGAVILALFRKEAIFGKVDGKYESQQHFADIEHVFGPFPRELLDKADWIVLELCFDNGMVKDAAQPDRLPLIDSSWHVGRDMDAKCRAQFVSFVHSIMSINPDDRPSADELLQHEWLKA